jgi:hypothetical protein
MKNVLFSHDRWNNHFSFNPILSFTNSNFIEIKNRLRTGIMYVGSYAFNRSFKKDSRNWKSLLFLR